MKKIIKNGFLFCIFGIFFLVPVGLTWMISERELSSYQQEKKLEFREMGYGEGKSIKRRNYKCYFEISGQMTSETLRTIQIEKENPQSDIRFIEGQEIRSGQILGTYKDSNVTVPYNAVVDSVDYGEDGAKKVSLRVIDAEELVLKAYVDEKTANELRKYEGKTLKGQGKTRVEVESVSNVINDEGTAVVFKGNLGNKHYGENITGMKIYTGEEYNGVLSIEKSCVYQSEEGGAYKIRILDDLGNYINELEVELGIDMGKYVGITGTGVSEGMLCDSGYAKLYETEGEDSSIQNTFSEGKEE